MPEYSAKSRRKLATCTVPLVRLFTRVIRRYDNSIITGYRGEEQQNAMFNQGRSKVRWPDGEHNAMPSQAVDAVPYPIPEKWAAFPVLTEDMHLPEIRRRVRAWAKELARFYHFGGYVQGMGDAMETPVRWGGDWDGDREFSDQTFDDLIHFEIEEKHE